MTWWQPSWRADPRAATIADRHYNRQSIGARQFVPTGRCVVLRHDDDALWITSWPFPEFVQHAWPGAWICSVFRNESDRLSSELIREAVAHTKSWLGEPPMAGMVTFVDPDRVRPKRHPGYCFLKAGFRHVGFTKGGLVALHLSIADMPDAVPVRVEQLALEVAS